MESHHWVRRKGWNGTRARRGWLGDLAEAADRAGREARQCKPNRTVRQSSPPSPAPPCHHSRLPALPPAFARLRAEARAASSASVLGPAGRGPGACCACCAPGLAPVSWCSCFITDSSSCAPEAELRVRSPCSASAGSGLAQAGAAGDVAGWLPCAACLVPGWAAGMAGCWQPCCCAAMPAWISAAALPGCARLPGSPTHTGGLPGEPPGQCCRCAVLAAAADGLEASACRPCCS